MSGIAYGLLSGSTNGKPIVVAATSSPGTTIHTAPSGTSSIDKVTLYAVNVDSADHVLTLEWGGTTDPANQVGPITIPANGGPILVGLFPIQNSLVIKAFAETTNVINIVGDVLTNTP